MDVRDFIPGIVAAVGVRPIGDVRPTVDGVTPERFVSTRGREHRSV